MIVQYGSSAARIEPREGWLEFMPFDELAELAREARVVVCHAGVGSILMARRAGKLPVVMARRHGLGEAVDDHQVELSRRLAASGLVTLVEDESDLAGRSASSTGTGGGPSSAASRAPTRSPRTCARTCSASPPDINTGSSVSVRRMLARISFGP